MDCSACGASNPSEARYCGGCGGALMLPCAECGKPVPLSNWFCGNCGAKFERGLSAGFRDEGASLAEVQGVPRRWPELGRGRARSDHANSALLTCVGPAL